MSVPKLAASLAIALTVGCASEPVDEINLMPAPDVYGDGMLNPLPLDYPLDDIPYQGVLYATDRLPAEPGDVERYYKNERGQILRVGVARVALAEQSMSWADARTASLLKDRETDYPIKVEAVDEWGMLPSTVPFWGDLESIALGVIPPDGSAEFRRQVNAQLARSARKDIYIFVHGYKVAYENPVLVSAELWHFLGYEGVFVAYSWPSTPNRYAYLRDSDTSAGFARNFRLLLEFLAEQTDATEINIIGYSNGSRLVTRALEQLALINQDQTREQIQRKLKINNLILVGADVDREVFGAYIADGLLDIPRHTSVYMSKADQALGLSLFLARRERLGQMFDAASLSPSARKVLTDYADQISAINVTDAEGAVSGNGHGYFRQSPWASSDILTTLAYKLTPKQRGLVQIGDVPVYQFPPDYIERLWRSLAEIDTGFARSYRSFNPAVPRSGRDSR